MPNVLSPLEIESSISPVLGSFIALLVFAAIAVIFAWMLTIMRKNKKGGRGNNKR